MERGSRSQGNVRFIEQPAALQAMASTIHPLPIDPCSLTLPLFGRLLPAGFPSPADDYLDGEIDLDLPPKIWIAFGWSFLLNFPWLGRSRMR